MIRNSAVLDEIAKLAGGAAGSVLEMKREVEALAQHKMEQCAANMQLVTREEFEIIQEIAIKARQENEKLSEEIAELKSQLRSLQEKHNPR